jgi:Kdo2-lipid IVA lauroyltransferase/acyltransferase
MKPWAQRSMLALMAFASRLPLPAVRGMGWVMGHLLLWLVPKRRKVARVNLEHCFPHLSDKERAALLRQHFVSFAQAWLDRGWLWMAPEATVRQRVRLVGAVDELKGDAPTLVFGPHFVGLDAAWMALLLHVPRQCCGLYARQDDALIDAWMAKGRRRFGHPLVVPKEDGIKPLAKALRQGMPLYLLPDMDHHLRDSVWATFFGMSAATLTSLPRLAGLGKAKVVGLRAELTPSGYDVHVMPAWSDYPTADVQADVQRMNHELERMVQMAPAQYFWVHKRFKTRPEGEASLYA